MLTLDLILKSLRCQKQMFSLHCGNLLYFINPKKTLLMTKFEETSAAFKKEMNELGLHFHEDLYDAIAKHLGPALYDSDASLVACSDADELNTVKTNFLIGKLGLEDGPELDKVIDQVCHGLGQSNTKKHRVTFYYLLTAILKKESVFIDHE